MKKAPRVDVFKDALGIGIDVSKAELAIVGLYAKEPLLKIIKNNMKAIEVFLRTLKQAGYVGKIICESTGHYHLQLALVCQELGMEIIVLNPLQSSKHSQSRVRKIKTDPEDALTLATMCITELHLPKPMVLTASKALIRLKMGQLASLEKQLQGFRRSYGQYTETYAALGLEESELQLELGDQLQSLKRLQGRLGKELESLLIEIAPDDGSHDRLNMIPGYSSMVAGLVAQFDREVKGERSWVAYVGMDISVRQSGTWKGTGRLTKRGNAYLRKRLIQAAWGACMNYDYVRAYYDDLKLQGRKHKEAHCIIARKLLRIAYQVAVNGKEYDPEIAFSH